MTPATPTGRPRWAYWLAVGAVLGVAVWVRAFDLGGPCFDCDELYAVRIQGATPKNVAAVMARDGFHTNHPPLMSVPFLAWVNVFGASEGGTRSLPLVAGVAAVLALVGFGRAAGRPWAGVFAAAILALNPLHVTYSAEARQYSLLVALLAVAQVVYVRAWTGGGRGWLLAYYAAAAWAALTHYFAMPVLLGHAAFAAWHWARDDGRFVARRLLLAVGLASLPYLAWVPVMRFQSQMKWDHLAPLTAGGVADSLPDLFGVGVWGVGVGLVLAGVVGLFALAGVVVAWRGRVNAVAPSPRLLPRWVGVAVLLLGVAGGIGYAVAFPKVVEPQARQTLAGYGYDDATTEAEIALLKQTGLLAAGCVAVAGVVLLVWPWVERDTPAAGGWHAGGFLLAALGVPTAAVVAGSFTGVPFHQTRNLLAFLPAVCVACGFTLDWLARRPLGAVVAVAVVVALGFANVQYHAVGRVVGGGGPRLGIDTLDWKELREELTARPRPGKLVLVNRPATDPGTHYLPALDPLRVNADATELPPRAAFVHLPDNPPSQKLLAAFQARGPLARTAAGAGWELWETP